MTLGNAEVETVVWALEQASLAIERKRKIRTGYNPPLPESDEQLLRDAEDEYLKRIRNVRWLLDQGVAVGG